MAQQNIDLGTRGNNQTGDDLNAAIDKVQDNFTDLYINKQNLLVSGTNIKTINSNSLLGSGNIVIPTSTDLSYNDSTRVLSSSTGTDITLPLGGLVTPGLVPSYSTGTLNVSLLDVGGGATYTINNMNTYYVKVGTKIDFAIDMTGINTIGTPTGTLLITGLGFGSRANIEHLLNVRINNVTSGDTFDTLLARIPPATSSISFIKNTGSNLSLGSTYNAPIFTNGVLIITGTYFTG